jgi:hypothetical protein
VNATTLIGFVLIFGMAYKFFLDGLLLIIFYQMLQITTHIYRYVYFKNFESRIWHIK